MRQLIQALELRFQNLESNQDLSLDTTGGVNEFAPLGHKHTESDITDLSHVESIFELTDGRSLEANIALVRNNARLAAEIATELSSQTRQN